MNCRKKKAVRALCVAASDLSRQLTERQNSSERTLPCYKENHNSQELSWWETMKVLESMHLTEDSDVTPCGKGQIYSLTIKEGTQSIICIHLVLLL